MILDFFRKKLTSKTRIQDIVFLTGIFIFSAVLILGLFPTTDREEEVGRTYYLYMIMTIPVITAIYFIIVSFRRKLYSGTSGLTSSIRFKIALAFVFVAIIPSLPIIILSNKLINHTLTDWISENDTLAMEESLKMAHESIMDKHGEIRFRLETVRNMGISGAYHALHVNEKSMIGEGFHFLRYKFGAGGRPRLLMEKEHGRPYFAGFKKLLSAVPPPQGIKIYNTSIGNDSIILGSLRRGNDALVLYRITPEETFKRISLYEEALGRYRQREFLKPYLQTGMGIFLLLLSIVIIVASIAVSFILSQGITRPVYELMAAARQIAAGNFSVNLHRDSRDELELLFRAFNRMAEQLEEGKVVMFQKQKLQAWRDIARKLVHEIKNPLTPIRLSAERMHKRYREGHPDLDNIIISGTETIIDEVSTLMEIIGEFSRFARLPEMKPQYLNINDKVKNCVNIFSGNENIEFILELDESIPGMYFDRILIRQAMVNIIQNAIDSIRERGSIHIRTKLVPSVPRDLVKISIRDDGIGIRKEDLDKIFEPAFSLKENGTGLGLAIVEKIILEHQGRIYCKSIQGEGSEFIIELPILKEEDIDGKDSDS